MRLAVVQMLAQGDREEDASRLSGLVADACGRGAHVVVLPFVPSLLDSEGPRAVPVDVGGDFEAYLITPEAPGARGTARAFETPLGRTMALVGDDAIDPALHGLVREAAPHALILRAQAESPLQAEAVLELALGYSTSLAGLVVVSATARLDPSGDPFGGSAILQHGEVLAEAVEPDDVLVAEVDAPAGLQQPVPAPPEPQPILAQRLAHHQGRKAPVDWLADLD